MAQLVKCPIPAFSSRHGLRSWDWPPGWAPCSVGSLSEVLSLSFYPSPHSHHTCAVSKINKYFLKISHSSNLVNFQWPNESGRDIKNKQKCILNIQRMYLLHLLRNVSLLSNHKKITDWAHKMAKIFEDTLTCLKYIPVVLGYLGGAVIKYIPVV